VRELALFSSRAIGTAGQQMRRAAAVRELQQMRELQRMRERDG
jgi:hypothetical protein